MSLKQNKLIDYIVEILQDDEFVSQHDDWDVAERILTLIQKEREDRVDVSEAIKEKILPLLDSMKEESKTRKGRLIPALWISQIKVEIKSLLEKGTPQQVNQVSEWVSVEDRLPETPKGFSSYSDIPVWVTNQDNEVISADFGPKSEIFYDEFFDEIEDVVKWQYRLPPQPPKNTEEEG